MSDNEWWAARRRAAEFWHKIKNTETAPIPEPPPDPRLLEVHAP